MNPPCGHEDDICSPVNCNVAAYHPERDLDPEEYDLSGTLTVNVEAHRPGRNGDLRKEVQFRRQYTPHAAHTHTEIMTVDELRDTLNALKRFFGEMN